jgi:hypothetical protein
MKGNNYTRGNIFRDKISLELVLKNHFTKVDEVVGSEAFLIGFLKGEDKQGLFLADLVYFGVIAEDIFILGLDNLIARVPINKLKTFELKDIDHPAYYFPPQIPPKKASLIAISWTNSNSLTRDLIIMFPRPAVFGFELEYPSQKVYQKLSELDKKSNFFTNNKSKDLAEFAAFLPSEGIPNEINDEECSIDEFVGYE